MSRKEERKRKEEKKRDQRAREREVQSRWPERMRRDPEQKGGQRERKITERKGPERGGFPTQINHPSLRVSFSGPSAPLSRVRSEVFSMVVFKGAGRKGADLESCPRPVDPFDRTIRAHQQSLGLSDVFGVLEECTERETREPTSRCVRTTI